MLKIYIYTLIFGIIISILMWVFVINKIDNSESFIFLKDYVRNDSIYNKDKNFIDIKDTWNSCISPHKAIFDVTINYTNKKEIYARFFLIKDDNGWKVIKSEVDPKYSIYKGCD